MKKAISSVTTAQMREADRRCIEDLGIPGAVLMNNAGAAVWRVVDELSPGGSVGIVCGKGNNGGDGFVVARLALLAGRDICVALLADPETVSGDAALFMNAFLRCGGAIQVANTPDEAEDAMKTLAGYDVLVDAILGTGIRGEVQGNARKAIDSWPDKGTIAVDIPSGLDSDTGAVCGAAVHAHTTVTFQFAKQGLLKSEATPYVGRLVVADIGIPDFCADEAAWDRALARLKM